MAQQPRVGLGLLKKPFPSASLLHASVLQFFVLKTRRSSRSSKIWPALSSCANWLGIEDFFSGALFVHSDNLTCPPFNLLYLMKLTMSDPLYD
ncbi:hypothetical protein TNCV_4795381 [Trichonephila clavipes]|nr:hypothetical protein TNCV_4795381 [Trichonephila clavipes]